MQIQTTINLSQDDTYDLTTQEAADAILKALGGDEDVDYCVVNVHLFAPPGEVGVPPTLSEGPP